jgi:hypothetical protein
MDDINGGVVEEDDLVTLTEETLRACSDFADGAQDQVGIPASEFCWLRGGIWLSAFGREALRSAYRDA